MFPYCFLSLVSSVSVILQKQVESIVRHKTFLLYLKPLNVNSDEQLSHVKG